MALRNGSDSFGWLTRGLHWSIAALVLGQWALGTAIAGMQASLSNLWLFGLHKSVGVTILALMVLRLAWHRLSPPPPPLPGVAPWQIALARATHVGFYVLLVLAPLSGWIASGASGLDVVVFGGVVLPPLAPASVAVEDAFFLVHDVLTKALLALIALHVAGAVKRAVAGDGTLRRMIRGR